MKSHTNSFRSRKLSLDRHKSFASLIVFFAILSVLSISGCTGLTSAGTPAGTNNTNSSSFGMLAASATSIAFGGVVKGASIAQIVTLTNTGSASITISKATIAGAGFSILGGTSAVTIPGGQSHTYQIQFTPQTTGPVSGSVSVASNASDSSLDISLAGTGVQALSITAEPVSQSVTTGQAATFGVTAVGNGTLTYQWSKNGVAISGATASAYTTPATTSSDNGEQFTVAVTGSTGTVTSTVAVLTVTTSAVAPSIATQPVSQTVNAGQTATFSVTATGTATLAYQWKKNGAAITGATSSSYTTPATSASDSGSSFTVTVTNSVNSVTSNAASLTVNVPPSITSQPANQTVAAGQTATFAVTATGTATLTYQWTKNGAAISGATSTSYTTPATSASDNGATFAVTVTNAAGNATSSAATLTVNVAPAISTQPASQTVAAGQTATFNVAATGTSVTYQWKKNGAAIGGATSSSYTTPVTSASDSGTSFTVTVSNSLGSVTSNAATLTVNVPPAISSQPANQTVTAGQAATFSVSATGSGTLTYQWKKNGTAISGAASASYTTPATAASDNGAQFTVTITDAVTNVTSNAATLTVNVLPTMTTQPANKTVIAGQTATFTAAATGTGTMTYQWKKNGTAISGATSSSYTTPATTTSDNGAQFTVTVNNVAGSITSNAATLTVNAATLVLNASTTTLGFSNVNIGSNSVRPVTFTNAGNSNIAISGVTISGAGYSASGVSTGQILTPGQVATLNVTFTPSATGSLPGNVTVTSNATNSPASVTLSGTGVQAVSHSATLTWTASTSTVSGYNIYRSTVSGGPYTVLNSSLIAGTQYVDSTVQAGQTYYYVATSVDSSGNESANSSQVSATVPTP